MSDEDALLAAIAAHPEEDTPRLAYADWLDEHADAFPGAGTRAEFIRVQCEVARVRRLGPQERDPRYEWFRAREQELLASHRRALFGPLGDDAGREFIVRVARGFVAELRADVSAFLPRAASVAALRPPPEVTVTGVVDRWFDLITDPCLPVVTRLVMQQRRFSGPLAISSGIVQRMGELGRHNRLRSLDLAQCQIGDGGLLYLAEHGEIWRLEELDLTMNGINYVGLVEFLESPIPAGLRSLNLSGNPLTEPAVRALAERWPVPGRLECLVVWDVALTPTGRQVLQDRFENAFLQ